MVEFSSKFSGPMVNHFRGFSTAEGHTPLGRIIDNDAPQGLRQEFVDLVFHLAEHSEHLETARIHQAATQSLGMPVAGQPYGGARYALGRNIDRADWPRVYDLLVRLWPDFTAAGCGGDYLDGVRRILAAHGIAWDMDDDGQLYRVMHPVVQARIDAALEVLSEARFAAAQGIFNDARLAYDDRPRRGRDACANAFDALEGVAKIVHGAPAGTFHDVLGMLRLGRVLNEQVVGLLESVNTLRNRNFGHGVPFSLRPEEVDFTYAVCAAGIVLLAR